MIFILHLNRDSKGHRFRFSWRNKRSNWQKHYTKFQNKVFFGRKGLYSYFSIKRTLRTTCRTMSYTLCNRSCSETVIKASLQRHKNKEFLHLTSSLRFRYKSLWSKCTLVLLPYVQTLVTVMYKIGSYYKPMRASYLLEI